MAQLWVVACKKCVFFAVRERSAVKGESYEHLKQTWNMANQHFIVAQDKLQQKVYFMEQKQLLLQQQRDQPTTSDSGLSVHSFCFCCSVVILQVRTGWQAQPSP